MVVALLGLGFLILFLYMATYASITSFFEYFLLFSIFVLGDVFSMSIYIRLGIWGTFINLSM
jgi:hypothetical protein